MNNQTHSDVNRKALLEKWQKEKKPLGQITGGRINPAGPTATKTQATKTSHSQGRDQLNNTHGGFVNKTNQQTINKTLSSVTIKPVVKPFFAAPLVKTALDIEIDNMFSLLKKNIELANAPQIKKNTHDFEKWKKKFCQQFSKEASLSFIPSVYFGNDIKLVPTRVQALNKSGERILSNIKFWVVYLKLVSEKLSVEQKAVYQAKLKDTFKTNEDRIFLDLYIGAAIGTISEPEAEDKENFEPHFGQITSEAQEMDNQLKQLDQGNKEEDVTKAEHETQAVVREILINANETFSQVPQPESNNQPLSSNVIPVPEEVNYHPAALVDISVCSKIEETPHFSPPKVEGTQNIAIDEEIKIEAAQELFKRKESQEINNLKEGDVRMDVDETMVHEDQQEIVIDQEADQDEIPMMLSSDVEIISENLTAKNRWAHPQMKNDMTFLERYNTQDIQEDINTEHLFEVQQPQVELDAQADSDICAKGVDAMVLEDINEVSNDHATLANITQGEDATHLDMDKGEIQKSQEQNLPSEDLNMMEICEEQEEVKDDAISRGRGKVSRKRKRSQSSTSMTLRSRNRKLQKTQPEPSESDKDQLRGSSYLKYEILERKGEKIIVPVRHSIRSSIGGAESLVDKKLIETGGQLQYKPNSNETLFPADKKTKEIQQMLKSKYSELLQREDILEIVDPDVGNKGQLFIVKIKPEVRGKFGGQEQIAASLGRPSKSPVKKQVRETMENLYESKRIGEMVVSDATEETVRFISKSRKH